MTKLYEISDRHDDLSGLYQDYRTINPTDNIEEFTSYDYDDLHSYTPRSSRNNYCSIIISSEHIMAFLNRGTAIREVTLLDGEELFKFPGDIIAYSSHRVNLSKMKCWWNVDVFQSLLDDGCDPTVRNNYAIRWVSAFGYPNLVKLLLTIEAVDPSADNNSAIYHAFVNRHNDIVKLLLADKRVYNLLSPKEIEFYTLQASK